jgi:hypothetical protein
MLILNFTYPFTAERLAQIQALTGRSETQVIIYRWLSPLGSS